jgi:protein-tyrosine phosphatase
VNDIFWVEGNPPVTLAIVLCPFGDDRLRDELLRMKRGGIQTVVSLLESEEAIMLGVAEEGPVAEKIGLQFLSYPIPDTHVPLNAFGFRHFVMDLANRIRTGEHIGVHCRGSIGRATVTAACTLIELGWTAREAIDAIQRARGCGVPDTQQQEDWILNYKATR